MLVPRLFTVMGVAMTAASATVVSSSEQHVRRGPQELRACLADAIADIARLQFSNDTNFIEQHVRPYNLNYPRTPFAVAYPNTTGEVSSIVLCAARQGRKVQARSGGHDYINRSIGTGDGIVVVDVGGFQQLSIDEEGIATVGSGHRLSSLVEGLYANGKRLMPHGIHYNVGVGGHATVGGMGFSSRMFGYTLDVMTEAEVVLSNGQVVRATADESSDLFWAIRGAAASFGIVTEFKFKTFSEPESIIEFTYPVRSNDTTILAESVKAYHQLIRNSDFPVNISVSCQFTQSGLDFMGVFIGHPTDLDVLDLFTRIPHINHEDSNITAHDSWLTLMRSQFEGTRSVFPAQSHFHSEDRMVPLSDLPTNSSIDNFIDKLYNSGRAPNNWLFLFDMRGGIPNTFPSNATSFPHRDGAYTINTWIRTEGATTSNVYSHATDAFLSIQGGTRDKYLSYAASPVVGYHPARYYGIRHYERLQDLKATYDPSDVFSTSLNIKAFYTRGSTFGKK
ncbi:FAD-binding domain-containing protein [Durotheca rogersii]|uniref:FAD-binding domain-containing protein n=1 Tax=Durotheca rogersii TaxID=419775 RepID=UPI00221EBFBB|nr:FAD-binding domain-containing protein [Durotheca rogersii]KAI5859271.1 FAD-binding domain-containing protein [Durotheca rogersii]